MQHRKKMNSIGTNDPNSKKAVSRINDHVLIP